VTSISDFRHAYVGLCHQDLAAAAARCALAVAIAARAARSVSTLASFFFLALVDQPFVDTL